MNILNCLYQVGDISIPISYEIVKKPIQHSEVKTKKVRRKSDITKNDLMRSMLKNVIKNHVKFKYVLADIWFASSENMVYIKKQIKKDFVFAMKSNRLVALRDV